MEITLKNPVLPGPCENCGKSLSEAQIVWIDTADGDDGPPIRCCMHCVVFGDGFDDELKVVVTVEYLRRMAGMPDLIFPLEDRQHIPGFKD